jgi:hypothetical protein
MRRYGPLAAIVLVFAVAVSLEIGWGLPGPRRTELLFPDGLTDELVTEMTERSGSQWAAAGDTPIPLLGRSEEVPAEYDRSQALDASRRFLLYTDNPDEMLALMALARIRPAEGRFDPGMGQYGGAFLYPLGAWLKASMVCGLTTQGDLPHYLRHSEDLGHVYVAGRAFVALCVALSIIVVFRIGERLGGPMVAVTAAGLVALSPAVLTWSVVLKPHAAVLLPGMLAVYWSLAYYDAPRWRTLLAAGAAAGLAAGMTMTAAPLALPVVLAVGLQKRYAGSRIGRAVAAVAMAAAAFLVTNPYTVISRADRLAESAGIRRFYGGATSPLQIVDYVAGPMREACGTVFLIAALVAMIILLAQQFRRAALLAVPFFAALLVIPMTLGDWAAEPQMARFALPILPLGALATAWWLDRVGALKAPASVGVLLLAAVVAMPTVAVHAASTAGHNPRYEAAADLNAAPAVPVLLEYPAAPFRAPPIDFLVHTLIYRPLDPTQPYVRVTTSWQSHEAQTENEEVYSLWPDRPSWLRAPLTFADRDVVLTLHAPAPPAPPAPSE